MECCEVEPRYTIEQIDLLQRLRLSGMTKPQIIHALESLERLDPDHRPTHCDSQPAPSNNAPTTAAPAPSSSSSSSSSSLSLASATTQTSGLDGAALSPSNSYEASPPPLYPPSVAVQRSFSYDMMGEEEWDLEEKVEEYMRRDSNLVKEEIKTFLNNRRISQAIVGQVTGISQSYISQWLLQQGLEMSDSKRRAFYRWYLLERNNPGLRWSESQHSVSPMPRARGGDRDGTVAGASGSLPNPNTNLNPNPVWSRQRELLMHLLPWYTAAAAAAQTQPGATLSMRSLVKEEPDWRTGIMAGDRAGMVGGPLRLRRGSRFTWRKECQSIMERLGHAVPCFHLLLPVPCLTQPEAAILESHGIEVPSPSCHSNGEEGEMQEFADQVNHRFTEQEETSSLRIVEQQDPSSLATTEVAALPSPTPQVLDQKEEDSKRETVDEE
ncbi:Homeobox-containing protein 1 [Collichthys lucidus]|uniref:Homeobox-containing protein 1 n=1 Tax=Collichthys lucidus TaxID=240159 RepID=A0A4U5VKZ0_COLLU|nr:Homeobox-containing protein 1 [Collichthys lucidus]